MSHHVVWIRDADWYRVAPLERRRIHVYRLFKRRVKAGIGEIGTWTAVPMGSGRIALERTGIRKLMLWETKQGHTAVFEREDGTVIAVSWATPMALWYRKGGYVGCKNSIRIAGRCVRDLLFNSYVTRVLMGRYRVTGVDVGVCEKTEQKVVAVDKGMYTAQLH